MAYWPKSSYGNTLLLLVAVGVVPIAVSIATVVPAALLAAVAAAVAFVCVGVYAWRRRVEAREGTGMGRCVLVRGRGGADAGQGGAPSFVGGSGRSLAEA